MAHLVRCFPCEDDDFPYIFCIPEGILAYLHLLLAIHGYTVFLQIQYFLEGNPRVGSFAWEKWYA